MRILLAAKHAPEHSIGGVQSWCLTVAAELRRLGHDAETWGPALPMPTGRFDAGIFANVGDTGRALPMCDRVLNISHGIIPAEKPGDGLRHAFTSEGVRDHWQVGGEIIRQPIDMLSFWRPSWPCAGKTLVRYSYRGGLEWLPRVAERLGMEFVHLRGATHAQARDVLRSAACVLATGRAALEAAACGAPIVILDHRSAYQGPLLHPGSPDEWMFTNYSGRGGVAPSEAIAFAEIKKSIERGSIRSHVENNHNVEVIVAQLLAAHF